MLPKVRLPKNKTEKNIGKTSKRRAQEVDAIPPTLLDVALGVAERAEAFESMVSFAPTASVDFDMVFIAYPYVANGNVFF